MLGEWLQSSVRGPGAYSTFTTLDIAEIERPSSATKNVLAERLVAERVDPEFLKEAARYLGREDIRDYVDSTMATTPTVRRGNFGEVVAGWAVEEFHKYQIAVPKLRFAIAANQTLPGTDVVAVRLSDTGDALTEVCFIESKLRTAPDTACAATAHDQLVADAAIRWPSILRFTAERLRESKSPLSSLFMEYLSNRGGPEPSNVETFRIFLTFDGVCWSETALGNLDQLPPALPELSTHRLLIEDLSNLIDEVYELARFVPGSGDE